MVGPFFKEGGRGSRKFRPEAEIFWIFSIEVAPYQLSTFVWGCFKLIKLKPMPFQVGTKLPLPFSLYLSHDVCSEAEDIEGEKGEEATLDIRVSG